MSPTSSTLIPCLRYRDAHAMIDWLCDSFGFVRHAVHDDEHGGVAHAQLTLEGGMIMLGSVRDDAYGQRIVQPTDIGNRQTQSIYVVVADCKTHYEQARAAGAHILDPYEEKDYGGAGYSCSDPEGHLWDFGSYDPWHE